MTPRPAVLRRLRRLRGMPGYRHARRSVVPRLRRSPTVRALLLRLFAVDASAPVPLDVAAGRLLGGVGVESLPVVLVVALGLPGSAVDRLVDEVARLQVLGAGFRPVFVTETPALAAARRHGYPCELLLGRDAYPAEPGAPAWEEYARERLALLLRSYGATATVTLGPAGLDDASRTVLSALRPAGS